MEPQRTYWPFDMVVTPDSSLGVVLDSKLVESSDSRLKWWHRIQRFAPDNLLGNPVWIQESWLQQGQDMWAGYERKGYLVVNKIHALCNSASATLESESEG